MSIDPQEWTRREYSWLERLPKVELHLHLEGSIPITALWELIQKHGGDPSVPTLQTLGRRFAYRDFGHFLDTWAWKNGFLREYEDFAFIAEAVAGDLVAQNIRYVEAFYSPGDFAKHGLEPQPITEAIRAGLSRVPAVEVALVADLVRDFGSEAGGTVLEQINEVKTLGVVGIGIGGSEHKVPPEVFTDVYERARQLGFRTSAHAGEAAGPESVWGAIRSLRVDRIGHGTRAREDNRLVDYLVEHAIPVELCPISNLRTGVVESIADHPARMYFDRGISISVNTDDPKMFETSLAQEFLALEQHLGFTRDEVKAVIVQAIRRSWLSESCKDQLVAEFERDSSWTET